MPPRGAVIRVPKELRVLVPLRRSQGQIGELADCGQRLWLWQLGAASKIMLLFHEVGKLYLCGPPVTSACNSTHLLFCFGWLILPLNIWVLLCAKELPANTCWITKCQIFFSSFALKGKIKTNQTTKMPHQPNVAKLLAQPTLWLGLGFCYSQNHGIVWVEGDLQSSSNVTPNSVQSSSSPTPNSLEVSPVKWTGKDI